MRIYRLGRKRELVAEVLNHSSGAHPLAIPSLGYKCGPRLGARGHGAHPRSLAQRPVCGARDRRRNRQPTAASPRRTAAPRVARGFPMRSISSTSRSSCARASPGRNRTSSCSSTTPPTRRTTSGAAVSTAFGSFGSSQYTSPGAGAEVMPLGIPPQLPTAVHRRDAVRRKEMDLLGRAARAVAGPPRDRRGMGDARRSARGSHTTRRVRHGREHGPRGIFLAGDVRPTAGVHRARRQCRVLQRQQLLVAHPHRGRRRHHGLLQEGRVRSRDP